MQLDLNLCAVCKKKGERHHIKHRGSGGVDDDWNILSLCRLHHIELHQIGGLKFIQKYSEVEKILIEKGWYVDNYRSRLWNDKINKE